MIKFYSLLLILLSSFCFSQYKVTRVIDGDTIEVLNNKKEKIRIRLAEIDCPEKGQNFSAKATKFTNDAVWNKTVEIEITSVDRYGRSIGKVYYNNKYLSAELVKKGLAIVYRKYSKDMKLIDLENKAKLKKIGIWSDPNFVIPEQFRKLKKKN
ncbi:Endonuclease YncB, thermonuclease family [Chishuiella changwenlii]|uniref:Endonuclease YncB, thermonuclease family n=1 Tax=Chishuiella changwenlii TaxID=1434701 RepID=A0A1M6XAC9_9FLAO|nr:thermonuclease family protein [Chishuiella changwenlii]GGF00274.1 hypothetical protein GCM10010984_17290 [Chishuiella changwenlii]SHL02878.1 Endonuclease YncB, thermonuclease family [Chishuiella changwenlii]